VARDVYSACPMVWLRQPLSYRICSHLGPVGQTGLIEDIGDVVTCGMDAYDKLFGDLPVGFARGDQAKHLYLPLGQAVGVGWDLEVFYQLQFGDPVNASPKLNRPAAGSSRWDGVVEDAITHGRDLEVFYILQYGQGS